MDKDKEKSQGAKEKSIWRMKHTPLKDRTTSSGITFWPEKVKENEQQ